MEKYFPYNCQKCGNCCRHVDTFEEMKNFNRGDGVCKNLTENNLCKIYSNRPPLCNGKFVYEKFFSNLTVEEFHQVISKLCKELKN